MRRTEEALAKFGRPQIFNTDQGSQFTSAAFTDALAEAGVAISMDGRGRWTDNVFVDRLWRSLKYEDVYLRGYVDDHAARRGMAEWIAFYNHQRPHQALADRTPMARKPRLALALAAAATMGRSLVWAVRLPARAREQALILARLNE